MSQSTLIYGASTTIVVSPASLASSSTFVAGRQSDEITNVTNKFIDALVGGVIRVGTTPTVNTQILVYAWGVLNDTPTRPDGFGAVDAARSITSVGVGKGYLRLLTALDVDATTTDRDYPFAGLSVANAFGGVMPIRWGIWIAHNTVAALNATAGNHVLSYQGIKIDMT